MPGAERRAGAMSVAGAATLTVSIAMENDIEPSQVDEALFCAQNP
jgi:hypothetical protein